MNKALATIDGAGDILEQVVIVGDLAKLQPAERVSYYKQVCESVGLNPLTKPFDYINLNGKLTLYACRDAADQLRQLHGVSVKVLSKDEKDGLYVVHVAAMDKHGRTDEDIGAVTIAGLRGEARANAMAKAMTKAKRRVTLSICGLGWLDESEVASTQGTAAPSQKLDDLFPTAPPGEAQVAEPAPQTPDVPDDKAGAPGASVGPLSISLFLDGDAIVLESPKEYFEEYLKQLKVQAEAETMPARERMTQLKQFEKDNADGLAAIPAAGAAKLVDWRRKLNRKLGVLAKKEQ